MRFSVVSIFPEMVDAAVSVGVVGKARDRGVIDVQGVNPRDFTTDRHRSVDDTPYGGGPGMVMQVGPLVAAIESVTASSPNAHRVLLSPSGAPLTQRRVCELASHEHLVLVCGRYEGIDERVAVCAIDEEISVGDFVLSGGEIAAAAIIDAVARYVPGVLGTAASTVEESFSDGLLEYPHYTRPAEFRGECVPAVLQSGDHGRIAAWRRERAIERTRARRPDLLGSSEKLASEHANVRAGVAARTFVALVHHPVYDRCGDVVTTAITTLDIHDIARAARTFGVAGYFVVTPVAAQREKVERVCARWVGKAAGDQRDVDHRVAALSLVRTVDSVGRMATAIEAELGARPILVATSARTDSAAQVTTAGELLRAMVREPQRPIVLLFGTGWGLTKACVSQCEQRLSPIDGPTNYNHLSVRSAVSIFLDRLFAEPTSTSSPTGA